MTRKLKLTHGRVPEEERRYTANLIYTKIVDTMNVMNGTNADLVHIVSMLQSMTARNVSAEEAKNGVKVGAMEIIRHMDELAVNLLPQLRKEEA